MASRDDKLTYELHVRVQPQPLLNWTALRMDGHSAWQKRRDRLYLAGVRTKIAFMHQFLQERARVGKEDLVLFSDVDVIPLRSFSFLTPLNSSGMWNSPSDIFFMPERHNHPGLSNWAVNVIHALAKIEPQPMACSFHPIVQPDTICCLTVALGRVASICCETRQAFASFSPIGALCCLRIGR